LHIAEQGSSGLEAADAILTFKRAEALAVLVCGEELKTALDNLSKLMVKAADNMTWDTREAGWFKNMSPSVDAVYAAMRKELYISAN